MAQPKQIIAVSVLIRSTSNHILLVQTHHRSDTWELPGGQAELGEGLDEAAKREVLEETGIEVKLLGICGVYYNATSHIVSVVFTGEFLSGEIRKQEKEIKDARFIEATEENINRMVTRPHMKSRILDALANKGRVPYETWEVRPYERISRLE